MEGANWNDTFWSNGRFDEFLVQARAELDESKRREMYVEMQSICRDYGDAVVPMFSSYVHAAIDKLKMPEHVAANWELDGHRQSGFA